MAESPYKSARARIPTQELQAPRTERRSPERLQREQYLLLDIAYARSVRERQQVGALTGQEADSLLGMALYRRQAKVEKTGEKLRDSEERFQRDPMTRLFRKELFIPKLGEVIQTGEPFGLLLTDLDGFGAINKRLGHPIGDSLIAQSGMRITEGLRETGESGRSPDLPFRIGGDEAAIIVRGARTKDQLEVAAQRIRTGIRSAAFDIPYSSERLYLTVSIGGLVWTGEEDPEKFYIDAGLQLVAAKGIKDTVVVQ